MTVQRQGTKPKYGGAVRAEGKMQEEATPTLKYGYADIKQPAKLRGRKLKAWRKRWVVLTLLNDLSRGGQPLARLDLYEKEEKWRADSLDRVTFILEDITTIREANSRTRPHALEIVGREPVLCMSGYSEVDSYGWKLALRQMLVPSQADLKKGTYQVCVIPNDFSADCGLTGVYTMTVAPRGIDLVNMAGVQMIHWALPTLMRFNVEEKSVLVIECGPNSPTGHSIFRFSCGEATDALDAIRQCVCAALIQKQQVRERELLDLQQPFQQQPQQQQPQQQPQPPQQQRSATPSPQQRQRGNPEPSPPKRRSRVRTLSATLSEKNYMGMLESMPRTIPLDRSDSDSSGASMSPSPLQHFQIRPQSLSRTSSLSFDSNSTHTSGFSHGMDTLGQDAFLNSEAKDENGNLRQRGFIDEWSSPVTYTDILHASSINHANLEHQQEFGAQGLVSMKKSGDLQNANSFGMALSNGGVANPGTILRPLRSSENLRLSATELEVVPERDENSASMSGGFIDTPAPGITPNPSKHVIFGIGDFMPLIPTTITPFKKSGIKNSINQINDLAASLNAVSSNTNTDTGTGVATSTLVELFDDLISPPKVAHRRYSSLPVTSEGNYSVIKDADNDKRGRGRAATLDDNVYSRIKDSSFLKKSEPNLSMALPERDSFLQVHASSPSSQIDGDKVGGERSMTKEGDYQEIDKKEDPYKTIDPDKYARGRWGRRRSCSMSDLSGTKLSGSKSPHFENVYEDVEDLKDAVRMLNKLAENEKPPELPARPQLLSFLNNKPNNQPKQKPRASTGGPPIGLQRKRRSFFNRSRGNNSFDSGYSELKQHRASASNSTSSINCVCQNRMTSPFTTCSQCGGFHGGFRKSPGQSAPVNYSVFASTEELATGAGSTQAETYADISDVREALDLGPRRRSSDITPVSLSLLDVSDTEPQAAPILSTSLERTAHSFPVPPASVTRSWRASLPPKFEESKPPALPRRRITPPSNAVPPIEEAFDLIKLDDGSTEMLNDKSSTTNNNGQAGDISTLERATPHKPPPASNPLISFFLDDTSFQNHPMVTGNLLPTSIFDSTHANVNGFSNSEHIATSLPTPDNGRCLFANSLSFPPNTNGFNPFITEQPNEPFMNNSNHFVVGFNRVSAVGDHNLNTVPTSNSNLHMGNPFLHDSILKNHFEQRGQSSSLVTAEASQENPYLLMAKPPKLVDARATKSFNHSIFDEGIYVAPS